MAFDVFGICNALFDIQAEVSDHTLTHLDLDKGSMRLIDEEQQRALVSAVYENLVNTEPGGSGCNTMIGLAQLGGTACYTSRVGTDEHGKMYEAKLSELGVKPNLGKADGVTGICLVLVTPDAQRTLCTYLGLSRDLQKSDINEQDIKDSKYIYVTGYLWDTDNQKEAVLHAMKIANQNGVKVSLSLSDPFCVGRHKEDFLNLLENHVDVVFGNKDEAMELTGTDSPDEAIRTLGKSCDVAVVTMDDKGSLILKGGHLHRIPAYTVKAIDTTGAGDMYAAGLLYGLSQGLPLDVTGRIASWCAAQVVAKLGPRLDSIDRSTIDKIIRGEM